MSSSQKIRKSNLNGKSNNAEEEETKIPLAQNNFHSQFEFISSQMAKKYKRQDHFETKKNKNQENINGEMEQGTLIQDYDMLSKPQTQMEVQEEKLLLKLNNHIVVCGIHSSIFHFILPLRAKYLKSYMQDIVLISPIQKIPPDIWDSISRFRRIFVITGSPLSKEVLKKAQIHRADKAVILGFDPTIKSNKAKEINDEMMDA